MDKDLLLAELIAVYQHFTILGLRIEGIGPNTRAMDFKNAEIMDPLGKLVPPMIELPNNIQELVIKIRKEKYNIE